MTARENEFLNRLTALEERLMHQDQLVSQLNEVILQQRSDIEELTRELRRNQAAIAELQQSSRDDDLPPEKPPHY